MLFFLSELDCGYEFFADETGRTAVIDPDFKPITPCRNNCDSRAAGEFADDGRVEVGLLANGRGMFDLK